jgi:hypothetical protein
MVAAAGVSVATTSRPVIARAPTAVLDVGHHVADHPYRLTFAIVFIKDDARLAMERGVLIKHGEPEATLGWPNGRCLQDLERERPILDGPVGALAVARDERYVACCLYAGVCLVERFSYCRVGFLRITQI